MHSVTMERPAQWEDVTKYKGKRIRAMRRCWKGKDYSPLSEVLGSQRNLLKGEISKKKALNSRGQPLNEV